MNEQIRERYDLTIERIRSITSEETVADKYRAYFEKVSLFLLDVAEVWTHLEANANVSMEELQAENGRLYADILGEAYESSYANPAFAVSVLGKEMGQFLAALYAELRGEIVYVYEKKLEYLTICNELFIEIYNCFEAAEEPDYKELKDIFYWFASDYCDVFVADRIKEQVDPKDNFAVNIIQNADFSDLRYLYSYGEYVGENEIRTAQYLNQLPQEVIDRMAEVYTEGYRMGFVAAGIDLSKKETVNIHYNIGFERMMKRPLRTLRLWALLLRHFVFR